MDSDREKIEKILNYFGLTYSSVSTMSLEKIDEMLGEGVNKWPERVETENEKPVNF